MPHPNPRLYLGYESLIRRFSLRVPPLQRIFVATEQTLEKYTFTRDGSERIELPLRRLSDPESYASQWASPSFPGTSNDMMCSGTIFLEIIGPKKPGRSLSLVSVH